MLNFNNRHHVGRGVEERLCADMAEIFAEQDTVIASGRPLLIETNAGYDTNLLEVVTLEVQPQRLYLRPALGPGYSHLGEEYRVELLVLRAAMSCGRDVLFGMSSALGFSVHPVPDEIDMIANEMWQMSSVEV